MFIVEAVYAAAIPAASRYMSSFGLSGPSHPFTNQVKRVISSPDMSGRSLLFMAVRSGSVKMFRKVFAFVSENLSPEKVGRCTIDDEGS